MNLLKGGFIKLCMEINKAYVLFLTIVALLALVLSIMAYSKLSNLSLSEEIRGDISFSPNSGSTLFGTANAVPYLYGGVGIKSCYKSSANSCAVNKSSTGSGSSCYCDSSCINYGDCCLGYVESGCLDIYNKSLVWIKNYPSFVLDGKPSPIKIANTSNVSTSSQNTAGSSVNSTTNSATEDSVSSSNTLVTNPPWDPNSGTPNASLSGVKKMFNSCSIRYTDNLNTTEIKKMTCNEICNMESSWQWNAIKSTCVLALKRDYYYIKTTSGYYIDEPSRIIPCNQEVDLTQIKLSLGHVTSDLDCLCC